MLAASVKGLKVEKSGLIFLAKVEKDLARL